MISGRASALCAFMRFTQYFLEDEIASGFSKSCNWPTHRFTSRKSRSSWHQALRLSQPADLVKKTSPDPFFLCIQDERNEEGETKIKHLSLNSFS